jgi:hypothetical protein
MPVLSDNKYQRVKTGNSILPFATMFPARREGTSSRAKMNAALANHREPPKHQIGAQNMVD